MDRKYYEKILNSIPETGVCVVRESDRALLYFNSNIGKLEPDARLGEPCAGLCDGLFAACLDNTDGSERRSAVVSNDAMGGRARVTAVKTQWEDEIPALVLSVTPCTDEGEKTAAGSEQNALEAQMAAILRSRFKMMNTVNIDTGMCERVTISADTKPVPPVVGNYESYINRALVGYVHPEDVPLFRATLSLQHLREKAEQTQDYSEEVCLYRQRGEPVRWIELHVIYARRGEGVTVHILGQDVTHEKNREELSNRALEDRAYIIGSLSSLFFATYYLDLEQDTFRTVTQLSRVGDVLGGEVSCSAALNIYANHFIHPDDREEYLKVMNADYLTQQLRWWQPQVAVEYRKLLDEPDRSGDTWGWVRATAVLARAGADDMPKTAIYVAQDIGGHRYGHSS